MIKPTSNAGRARQRGRWMWLIGAASFLMSASGGFAETLGGFTIFAEGYDYDYTMDQDFEYASDKPFIGGGADYTLKFHAGYFLRAQGRYSEGKANLNSVSFGTADKIPYTILDARIEWGRDFYLDGGPTLAPYIGLGYRSLDDESGGHVTDLGVSLYDRQVEFLYLPIGLTAFWSLGSAWSISTRLEVSPILHGQEQAGPPFDLNFELSGGLGLGAEFLVRKRLLSFLALSVGPFIRYWNIDDSEVDDEFGVFFIPSNKTVEAGVTFKITF